MVVHRGPVGWWVALLLATASGLLRAADGPPEASSPPSRVRYAVLPLIGDDLSIVTYRAAVGSNLDTNVLQHVANDDDRFDRIAVQNAAAAIRGAVPGAVPFRVKPNDPADYALGDEALRAPDRVAALVAALRPALGDARYLLVIGKSRGDARLKTSNGTVGSGKLTGLGFYLDYRLRTRDGASGARGRGFVAPYAYLAVWLIDVNTGDVLRSAASHEGFIVSTARSGEGLDPWEALTAEQKVAMLGGLIRRAIETVVPQVVTPTRSTG